PVPFDAVPIHSVLLRLGGQSNAPARAEFEREADYVAPHGMTSCAEPKIKIAKHPAERQERSRNGCRQEPTQPPTRARSSAQQVSRTAPAFFGSVARSR